MLEPKKRIMKLKKLFPKKYWVDINYILVRFGRTYNNKRKNEDIILKKIKNN
jgi:endonuclease III